jgi:hypothetical protein
MRACEKRPRASKNSLATTCRALALGEGRVSGAAGRMRALAQRLHLYHVAHVCTARLGWRLCGDHMAKARPGQRHA